MTAFASGFFSAADIFHRGPFASWDLMFCRRKNVAGPGLGHRVQDFLRACVSSPESPYASIIPRKPCSEGGPMQSICLSTAQQIRPSPRVLFQTQQQPSANAFSGVVANGGVSPPRAGPTIAGPAPVQRHPLQFPSIPVFHIPEEWERPDCLPLTPPPSPPLEAMSEEKSDANAEPVGEKGAAAQGGSGSGGCGEAKEGGVVTVVSEPDSSSGSGGGKGGSGSNSAEENAKAGEKGGVGAAKPPAEKDPVDVDNDGTDAVGEEEGRAGRAERSKSATAGPPASAANEPESSSDAKTGKDNGKSRKLHDDMDVDDDDEDDEDDDDDDDNDDDDDEDYDGRYPGKGFGAPVRLRPTRAQVEREKVLAQKKAAEKEAAEAKAAAAAAKAAAKAKAEAEAAANREAAKKAEAAKKEADLAERVVETSARRVRVNLLLRRLREDAEEKQRRELSYAPNDPRYYLGPNAGADDDGDGANGVPVVPRLTDRTGRDSDRSDRTSTSAKGGEKLTGIAAEKDGDKSTAGTSPAGAAVAAAKPGADDGYTYCWPPLGQRRLNRRLERVRKFSEMSQGPGPHRRLRFHPDSEDLPQQDGGSSGSSKPVGGSGSGSGNGGSIGGKGGWLEARLARMRRNDEADWKAWKRRLEEEAAEKPREVAGPSLPFGFVPRLAHRALGAYALIRTFSRPFRLAPCTSVAFLRAMTLQLRNPLLDAVHCELLKRVSCSLKGRLGGWSKGKEAMRELDWRCLDQVNMMRCCGDVPICTKVERDTGKLAASVLLFALSVYVWSYTCKPDFMCVGREGAEARVTIYIEFVRVTPYSTGSSYVICTACSSLSVVTLQKGVNLLRERIYALLVVSRKMCKSESFMQFPYLHVYHLLGSSQSVDETLTCP